MLAAVGRDRERLLHQTIRLIAIPIRSTLFVWLGTLHAVPVLLRLVETVAPTLALHLAVREKAA